MTGQASCYTIISSDVPLLRRCVENARERAGIEHEWIVVGWSPTDGILAECDRLGVRCVPMKLPESPGPEAHPEQRTAWFIRCLYQAWNAGYEHSTSKWVARLGSDQYFSKNWLANLLACAERHGDRSIYDMTTVESPVAKRSRHEIRDWGTTPGEFDEVGRQRFDSWANDLAYRMRSNPTVRGDMCDLWYNHPTRGRQRRSDGCSWLQTRDLWSEFGPMPDAVMHGVSPDVAYRDAIQDAGVSSYLCLTASTYHLVAGESRDIQGHSKVVAWHGAQKLRNPF